MAKGKVAAGLNKEEGILSLKPAVNITEAASPIPLPKAINTAVTMPGRACRTTTFMEVSSLVAPRAYEASKSSLGTIFTTSSMALLIMGRIKSATVIIPANNEAHK